MPTGAKAMVADQLRRVRDRLVATGASRSASSLVIEAHLRTLSGADGSAPSGLNDAVGYVTRLRDLLEPARMQIRVVKPHSGPPSAASRRLDTWLDIIQHRLPPMALDNAVALVRAADVLAGDRDPLYAADVSDNFLRASSFGAKGRLLAALARVHTARRALELGTAFGMSGMCLLSELARVGGTLDTVEMHPAVHAKSQPLLTSHFGDSVRAHLGTTAEVLSTLDGGFDLVFHDAAHSDEDYRKDFAALEPLTAPGALLLLDDIRWEPHDGGPSANTYKGWLAITEHPRVERAVEINGDMGLVSLS